jgi:ABC-type Mn2+/Zn2+ transport system permease subunit
VSVLAAPLFGDAFSRRALLEVVLVGALAGLVGVHVVLRRLAFFTQAMTHATFPGVVLAALLGVNLLAGTGLFGVLAVLAVAWLWSRPGADETSVIGVVLSAGFALGVALLSAQAGFSKDLSGYLVGSVLTVGGSDLLVTAGVLVAVVLVLTAFGKELILGAFDRGALVALGYPAGRLDVVLLLVIEATIVAAVPAVGTILSVALIVAPAATARLWTDRLGPMTAVAVGLGMLSGAAGLTISQLQNVAAGAAIVLVACGCFALSWLLAPRYGAVARWRAGAARTSTVDIEAADAEVGRPEPPHPAAVPSS